MVMWSNTALRLVSCARFRWLNGVYLCEFLCVCPNAGIENPTLISLSGIELCLPGWRFSMTMVANFVVLGGQMLMPGLAVLCGDWQVLQAVIICPLFLMLSYIW